MSDNSSIKEQAEQSFDIREPFVLLLIISISISITIFGGSHFYKPHIFSYNPLMDGFDLFKNPPDFQAWGTTSILLNFYTNTTWPIVYFGLVYRSIKDKSYGMSLIPQCLDIAWEITYGAIFPPSDFLVKLFFKFAFLSNGAVLYTTIKHGSREWDNAPLVKHNLALFYLVGITTSILGHVYIAEEIGPTMGCFLSAIACQAILSVGCLGQLLTRGSTRGFSFALWFVIRSFSMDMPWLMVRGFLRFTGSLTLVPEFYLRAKYWPEVFGWLGKQLCCGVPPFTSVLISSMVFASGIYDRVNYSFRWPKSRKGGEYDVDCLRRRSVPPVSVIEVGASGLNELTKACVLQDRCFLNV
jgi:paspaline synthase